MAESPSAVPHLQGLEIEAVEWLPSGADSGLVRVRGRWSAGAAVQPGLPELGLLAGGAEHRFESLPDARFARDPASWRGSYLVPVALVAAEPEALWVEWPGGVRSGLPSPSPGLASPAPVPALSEPPADAPGGQVIDRAVLAERRARRAEAAEQAQARVAAEALRAVEALELQSAELERRLGEVSAERDALAEPAAPPDADLARVAERRQAALAAALDALARVRSQSREWRLGLRTGEVAHASDAVRLAVLEAERALGPDSPRGALRERTRELEAERSRAAELEAARAGLESALARARDEAEAAREALGRAREEAEGRLAAALAAAEATREELEGRRRGERVVHEEVREELQSRLRAAEERAGALEAAQAELLAGRASATARAESLGARIAELESALERAETGLATAEASAANAEARLRVETVARAALEAELDRTRDSSAAAAERDALAAALDAERLARAAERDALVLERDQHASGFVDALAAELEAERDARAGVEADLSAERDARAAVEADLSAVQAQNGALREELEGARAARGSLEAELEGVRAERGSLAADLEAERAARASAEADLAEASAAAERRGATLQDRIAELERGAASDEGRLAEAARAHAEAAAAAPVPAERGRIVADLDAAATALRSAEPPPAPADAPSGDLITPGVNNSPLEAPATPASGGPVPVEDVRPPAERPRRTIVSPSSPPPRTHVVGRSARDYPRLRGAIVKLAHDDAAAAARLLAALLPAQAVALSSPLDYDLTIAEAGTFAVTLDGRSAVVRAQGEPRGRGRADFHLSADALTLAELLAGIEHRIGRWRGPARFSGSRRKLAVLRALPGTEVGLAEAARAGAALEPSLVYRTLSYAVHPSWTKGERFTLAQEITGERPETWYLSARDGAGMAVSASPPEDGVEATVSMSRETFGLMLRGDEVPSGARPSIRGDLRVVALVKAWMDRAQHGV